ncbi:hypothetical protein SESBI_18481 [Sesbania bispinosa]|nr:hypothetical protein SESBI_18481 [Sesbania bispinosa]
MPVVFKPPKCMLIDEMDAKIAAYIFAADYVTSLPGDEVLIKSKWTMGKRSSLKTLMPTRHLHHDVLNMLVCKLTEEEQILDTTSTAWFLPTMFAEYALHSDSPQAVMEQYQDIEKPDIAGFTLIELNGIGQELPVSNDSGVWVATCMMDYDWDDEYDKISERTIRKITTASRMRLAIDLVKHNYNKLRDNVINRAKKNWKNSERHRETIMKAIFG